MTSNNTFAIADIHAFSCIIKLRNVLL